MYKNEITGIVLAGGKSSRMGTDKSLMIWKNKSLVEHAINTLKPLCNKVVISAKNNQYQFTGCEVWPDELTNQAPMIGIYSCLKRSQTEVNLILSCDMPLISPDLFEYLLSNSSNHKAVVPVHNIKQIEPLCGIYKKSVLAEMEKFIKNENYSLQQFLKASSARIISITQELSFFKEDLFLNVNTMEDFNKMG